MGGPIKLFRVAGIQVFLHWSWFLVAIYEIQARAGSYGSPGWNVLEYLALFAIVTMHEFGHALACRSVGGTAERILLWPLGGVAYVDAPQRPGAQLWSLAAGPLVNVALAPVLWVLANSTAAMGGNLAHFCLSVEYINLGLLVFNLLPVYPLDGGQILRSLLWYPLGRARSLMAATIFGFAGLAGLALLAVRFGVADGAGNAIWLLAIAAFIVMNCWKGLQHSRALWQVSRIPRRPGFACPSCSTAPPRGDYWQCGQCHRLFDTFATGARCPQCTSQFTQTACLDCGRVYPMPSWVAAGSTMLSA